MTGELAFFELGVEDADRARAFYGALLGWSFTPGPSGGGYVIGAASVPGGVHGGDPGASPYVFFRVDDVGAATARVRELGGSVEGSTGGDVEGSDGSEGVAATPYGRFVLCRDDQGSAFGLVELPAPTTAGGAEEDLVDGAPGGAGSESGAGEPDGADDVIALERAGWAALATGPAEAVAFYDGVLADDAVMLLPGGLVLTGRTQIAESMGGPPWTSYVLEDVAVVHPTPDTALVRYSARAVRGDREYSALFSSLYVRAAVGWRLVSHQQTPR